VFNLTFEFKLNPTATQIAVFEDWLEQCPDGVQLDLERAQRLVQLTQMSDRLFLQKLRVHHRC